MAFAADDQNSWIADSGATSHVCRDRNLFTDYTTTQGGTIRGTGIINVHGGGPVKTKINFKKPNKPNPLQNFPPAPQKAKKLVLLSRATDSGLKIVMEKDDLKIHSPKG